MHKVKEIYNLETTGRSSCRCRGFRGSSTSWRHYRHRASEQTKKCCRYKRNQVLSQEQDMTRNKRCNHKREQGKELQAIIMVGMVEEQGLVWIRSQAYNRHQMSLRMAWESGITTAFATF
ncbi:hypothetical protein BRADI_1g47631v3 [Brachypodium distachyon]|uniref:Uncharacterized protein n=1 Tax=Brachypodium distachyon TaxID=15368 RepID=A0A2K2DQ32_BRADI|nr:hypothetical protein BRADI_1g47631v3 [Brachypodium distachyon]